MTTTDDKMIVRPKTSSCINFVGLKVEVKILLGGYFFLQIGSKLTRSHLCY